MGNRKKIKKEIRELVLNKYDRHCAYCGQPLTLKTMQVDHIQPLHLGGLDDLSNYNPACRSCNHYKSTLSLEKFRKQLEHIPFNLERSVIFNIACRFGLIEKGHSNIVFYFERGTND